MGIFELLGKKLLAVKSDLSAAGVASLEAAFPDDGGGPAFSSRAKLREAVGDSWAEDFSCVTVLKKKKEEEPKKKKEEEPKKKKEEDPKRRTSEGSGTQQGKNR